MFTILAAFGAALIAFLGAWLLQERALKRNRERLELEMEKTREELKLLKQQMLERERRIVLPTEKEREMIEATHRKLLTWLKEGGEDGPPFAALLKWALEDEHAQRIQFAARFLSAISELIFQLRCLESGTPVDKNEVDSRIDLGRFGF